VPPPRRPSIPPFNHRFLYFGEGGLGDELERIEVMGLELEVVDEEAGEELDSVGDDGEGGGEVDVGGGVGRAGDEIDDAELELASCRLKNIFATSCAILAILGWAVFVGTVAIGAGVGSGDVGSDTKGCVDIDPGEGADGSIGRGVGGSVSISCALSMVAVVVAVVSSVSIRLSPSLSSSDDSSPNFNLNNIPTSFARSLSRFATALASAAAR
jgi:hypothetical protein